MHIYIIGQLSRKVARGPGQHLAATGSPIGTTGAPIMILWQRFGGSFGKSWVLLEEL